MKSALILMAGAPVNQNALRGAVAREVSGRLSSCFQSAARLYGLGSVTVSASDNRPVRKKQRRRSQELILIKLPRFPDRVAPFVSYSPDKPSHVKFESAWIRLKEFLNPRTRGIFLLNLLSVLYGSNATVIKESQSVMDPAVLSALRFLIATMAFSPFLIRALSDKRMTEAGLQLGVLASVGYLSQSLGLITTDAGRASFIGSLTVIVVPLVAGFTGAHVSRVTWISAATALLGIGLLESSGAPASVGDIWSLVTAVAFGVHMIRTEHFSKSLPSDAAMPVLSLQLLLVALLSSIWSLFRCANQQATVHLQETVKSLPHFLATIPWLALLYTGFLSTAFCLWIELVALRDVSSTEAAIIYTLEPVWGAGFAWMFLGERWSSTGWLGAALILGASLTMQLFGSREDPEAELVLPATSVPAAPLFDTASEEHLGPAEYEARQPPVEAVSGSKVGPSQNW